MKKIVLVALALTVLPALAHAQSSNEKRGWGYGFVGVGGTTGTNRGTLVHAGAGGEGLIVKGLGIGAEVGYLKSSRGFGDGVGILSVNPSYHFAKATSHRKLVPFVTGGVSLAFTQRFSAAGGGNIGGGVQYWGHDRVGLRLEFRNHIFSSDSPHFYQIRVGVSFR